jgi:hypothetical protein
MKNSTEDTPFSYLVKVGHISANPVEVHLEADKKELQALAETWDVISVDDFRADLQIARWKRDGVRVKGRVQAKHRSGLRRHARARAVEDRRNLRADLRA